MNFCTKCGKPLERSNDYYRVLRHKSVTYDGMTGKLIQEEHDEVIRFLRVHVAACPEYQYYSTPEFEGDNGHYYSRSEHSSTEQEYNKHKRNQRTMYDYT